MIAHFYIGSMISSLQKVALVPGAEEALVYSTINGAIGVFLPFVNKEEFELFQTLEMHMRVENPPLCGRDHLAYRSYYCPAKSVVDGDICEQYSMLESSKQREIGENLGRKATEVRSRLKICFDYNLLHLQVIKKLEDMRTRYAY